MYVVAVTQVQCTVIIIRIIVFYIVAYCSQGCYNGGVCTSPYTCTCMTGWTGADCKIGLCIA